ncbi:uncharacterized protein TNCV_2442691 [Trichonephila clavipes]|nr:uncharacterized protein TNCV_2442691 [Trichonephila clavipes]
MGIISILCCPECYATGLKLAEDSKEELCSNLCVACSCGFMTGFTSTPKENKKFFLNTLLVFGLRLIGRGFTAGKKLCTLNLPYISKNTFRAHELMLEAVQLCSEENMKAASKEVQNFKKSTTFGVSVDGSWQRRGHLSLNGCVSVISIDTGKILDLDEGTLVLFSWLSDAQFFTLSEPSNTTIGLLVVGIQVLNYIGLDVNWNSYPGLSSGRPRGTTPADDRYIVLQPRRNWRQTMREIVRYTTLATGRPISRFTVARRLHGGGLFARCPVRCVPLTPAHRRRRSLWCR